MLIFQEDINDIPHFYIFTDGIKIDTSQKAPQLPMPS